MFRSQSQKDKKNRQEITLINESQFKTRLAVACYLTAICTIGFASPAYADWFNVAGLKANLITPTYTVVKENLGYVAFVVGGVATYLARGMDLWQKSCAFAGGCLGTGASVKIAETTLHLGSAPDLASIVIQLV